MKVLVTGGNGFIGRHVCEALKSLGHVPTVFDRYWKGDSYTSQDSYFGDVFDSGPVDQAVYHHDGVIHLAAVLGTQETIANPFPAVQTNILGSLNVFEAVTLYKKPCVYIGVGNYWMNNPYSISKTTAERFALMYNRERGTRIAVVRGMNAYGPGQKAGPVRKMIPNFILSALKNEPLTVYGDGSQIMDTIYVSDLADILCRALLSDHGVYDRVFEAGTGVPTTVLQIAYEVLRQANPKRLAFEDAIRHIPMRPGELPGSTVLADVETLRPLVCQRSWCSASNDFMGIEAGIASTIPFYRVQLGLQKTEVAV